MCSFTELMGVLEAKQYMYANLVLPVQVWSLEEARDHVCNTFTRGAFCGKRLRFNLAISDYECEDCGEAPEKYPVLAVKLTDTCKFCDFINMHHV